MYFNPITTGDKIRILRESKKWSQTNLADQLDLTRAYISKLERGESIARVEIYITIAELFNVSLDYLLKGRTNEVATTKLNTAITILESIKYDL